MVSTTVDLLNHCKMDASQLRPAIFEAFDGVILGDGIGLWQAQGIDDRLPPEECEKIREKDEKQDWRKLSVLDLYRCSSSLCFFDAEGMRFHFPQFALLELGYFQNETKRLAKEISSCLEPYLLFHLEDAVKHSFSRDKFKLFNTAQLRVVVDFIKVKMHHFEKEFQDLSYFPDGPPESFRYDSDYIKMEKTLHFWENYSHQNS